jgi:hypothetical protein
MATPKPVLKILLSNTETLPNLIPIRSENISKGKKRKLFLHFLQFLNDFFFKKTLKMFSVGKIIFFIIRSAKKYNNNNKKNSGQKIRTGDIVVAVFVLYRCTVGAATLQCRSA